MFNTFYQWPNKPYFWLTFSCVVVILPLLLLGEPGLYGDDLNVYLSMEQHSFKGAITHWLNEYGWSYRPVGITVLYSYYALLSESPFFLYLGYQLCYVILALVLYREVIKLTASVPAGIFAALFFVFFPFNPTAYWQVSSLMMVVATLFVVMLIRPLMTSASKGAYGTFFCLSLCWLLLLFSYEQLLGLAAVISLCIVLKNYTGNWFAAIKKSMIPVAILALLSIIFLVAYLSSSSNPKLVSLNAINAASTAVQLDNPLSGDATAQSFFENYVEDKVNTNNVYSGRLGNFLARIEKATHFLLGSVAYSSNSLAASGIFGYIVLLAILFLGLSVVASSISVSTMTKQTALLCVFFGSLWVVVTLAPFFVYSKVNIPPYTLMLPSIGLGIAIFGFLQFILLAFSNIYLTYLIKCVLAIFIIVMPLIQYGYYAGLKEELSYWDTVATKIQKETVVELNRAVIVNDLQDKDNRHIFWLEKAIGLRYISAQLDQRVLKALHNKDKLLLILDER